MSDPRRLANLDGVGVGDVLAVAAGAVLLKMAFVLKNVAPTFERPAVVAGILLLYLTAFLLIVVGVTDFDLGRYGRWIGYFVFAVVCSAFAVAYVAKYDTISIGTDAILFAHYATDLLLDGANPYAHSMQPAFEQYPVDERYVTYRTDGSVVASYSYPALSILAFIPQAILGASNFNLTSVFVLLVVVGFLVYESPPRLTLAPFVVVFADRNLALFSAGGVFDVLWVLPLLLAMKYWSTDRLRPAAFLVGLAFAVKQTPWFIGPFLGVWVYMESESFDAFKRRAGETIAFGMAGFGLPNLPFLLWNPGAWLAGVFTPIAGGAALVQQGRGIVMLSASGVFPLPKSYFSIVMLVVLLALLVVYALYFERVKWLAWVVPAFVLWFNYRSLQNYFVFFAPIAYYAILLRLDLARHQLGDREFSDGSDQLDPHVQAQ